MALPLKLLLAAPKGVGLRKTTLQKFTVGGWDPITTLRQLAASVLGPDADESESQKLEVRVRVRVTALLMMTRNNLGESFIAT